MVTGIVLDNISHFNIRKLRIGYLYIRLFRSLRYFIYISYSFTSWFGAHPKISESLIFHTVIKPVNSHFDITQNRFGPKRNIHGVIFYEYSTFLHVLFHTFYQFYVIIDETIQRRNTPTAEKLLLHSSISNDFYRDATKITCIEAVSLLPMQVQE